MASLESVTPCHILCVDDEDSIRNVLGLLLNGRGHRAEAVASAVEAWEILGHRLAEFDVVITDNTMPGMTGFELVERLRAAAYPGRIIMFSGFLARGDLERAKNLGITVVQKGVDGLEGLMAAIGRC